MASIANDRVGMTRRMLAESRLVDDLFWSQTKNPTYSNDVLLESEKVINFHFSQITLRTVPQSVGKFETVETVDFKES
jgi:hypothetical protein